MISKIFKSIIALSLVFTLMLVKKNNVYAAETNLEGVEGLFTKPSDIHEDADLLSELDIIGKKLNEKQVKDGVDLYRWLYDVRYLNMKYSNSVSSSSINTEINRALSKNLLKKRMKRVLWFIRVINIIVILIQC